MEATIGTAIRILKDKERAGCRSVAIQALRKVLPYGRETIP